MLVRVTRHRRNGRGSYPRDVARMKFDHRNAQIVYYPSAAREGWITEWEHGCIAEFEVDDASGRPRSLRLMPAPPEEPGFKLRGGNGQRSHLCIPTRGIGVAVPGPSRAVEEVEVSPNLIEVGIPFAFTVARAAP